MFILDNKDTSLFLREEEFTDNTISELMYVFGGMSVEKQHYFNVFREVPNLIVDNLFGDFEIVDADSLFSFVFDNYEGFIHTMKVYDSINARIIIGDMRDDKNGVDVQYYSIEHTKVYPMLNTALRNIAIDKLLETL